MRSDIQLKLNQIIDELVEGSTDLSVETKLAIIGSDSIRAIAFVTAIEEEWDTSILDDSINSDFFSNIEYITDCILASRYV